jgi:hypothetical protein
MSENFVAAITQLIPELDSIPRDSNIWNRARSRFYSCGSLAGPATMGPGEWLDELNALRESARSYHAKSQPESEPGVKLGITKPFDDQIRDGDVLVPDDSRSARELAAEIGIGIYFLESHGFAIKLRPLFYALADRLAEMETRAQNAELDILRLIDRVEKLEEANRPVDEDLAPEEPCFADKLIAMAARILANPPHLKDKPETRLRGRKGDQFIDGKEAAEALFGEYRERAAKILAKSVPANLVTLEFSSEVPPVLYDVMQFADRVRVNGKLVKNRFGDLKEEPAKPDVMPTCKAFQFKDPEFQAIAGVDLRRNNLTLVNELHTKCRAALAIAMSYGGPGCSDTVDHARWVIDQMVRALTGDRYEDFVRLAKNGEDGPETYAWEEGVAP